MIINCDCNKEQLYRKRLATGASFFIGKYRNHVTVTPQNGALPLN